MVPPRAPLLGNASVTRLRPAKPTSAGGTEVAQGRDTLAPERHGPGGPTGLQNRCGVAAPRSVGSTPAPLRQPKTAWVKAFRAVLRGTLGNTPSVLTSGDRLGRPHAGTARAREVQVS